MSSAVDASADDIFTTNPYAGHTALTPLESEVLWEYAKLSQHVKLLVAKTRELTEEPDQKLVEQLRNLEPKLGLVLTLFKASVWGAINEDNHEPSAAEPSYDDSADTTIQQT